MKSRVHVFISGRVQGVFFRDNTAKRAKRLGLKGWVKNLSDGRVEAIFEGEKNKIKEILKWAQHGPLLSQVTNLDIRWEKCRDEFNDFEIRY